METIAIPQHRQFPWRGIVTRASRNRNRNQHLRVPHRLHAKQERLIPVDLTFKIEDISACEKQLEVEIAAEEVRREFDEFYRNLKPKASIRGFRKGRIPRSYLEKFFRNEA
ncbi:MAG: trigger factor family protein, partial [Deltaproteobacteria bacterium]